MSRHRFNHAAAVFTLFTLALVTSNPARSADAVEFLQPQQGDYVVGQDVTVKLRFPQQIDWTTFGAQLNGKDVTSRFTAVGADAMAVLTLEDGLKVNGSHDRGAPNHLVVKARQKAVSSGEPGDNRSGAAQRLVSELRFFFKAVGNGGDPSEVTATIPPSGGSITLDGYGTVTFPEGSFPADQQVSMSLTSDPDLATAFNESTIVFDPGPRASTELHINTGSLAPAESVSIDVVLTVPPTLLSAMPADHEPVLFILMPQDGGDEMQHFELFYPSYDSNTYTLTAKLPFHIFSNVLTVDGTHEAVMVVGTNLRRVTVASVEDRFYFDTPQMGPMGSCAWAPDVHKILFPPLDGKLLVESSVGYRPAFGRGHYGTDYRTLNYATLSYDKPDPSLPDGLPVTNLPVRSMADGTIYAICYETNPKTGCNTNPGTRKLGGWGYYIVVRHTDGSKALYGHLIPESATKKVLSAKVARGEILAQSGRSGLPDTSDGKTGPHLHVEFTPLGADPAGNNNYWAKASVEPCIKHNLYVPLRDSGYKFVLRYNLMSDYQLQFEAPIPLPTGLPFGASSATAYNLHWYAAGGPASRDGTVFATFPDEASFGVAVNRKGVLVADTTHAQYQNRPNKIHLFSHDGTTELSAPFTLSGFFNDMFIGASENFICAFDNSAYQTAVLNANGQELFKIPSADNACAATNDRIYAATAILTPTGFQRQILAYDGTGNRRATVSGIPYWVDGIAVTEKNLFVSAHYGPANQVFVYNRSVVRDNDGLIVTDDYTFKGALTLERQPGSLGVE